MQREEQQDLLDFFSSSRPDVASSSAPARPHSAPSNHPMSVVSSGPRPPEVVFERSLRATNYRLTLRRDGVALVTIPVRGSEREARRFLEAQQDWLERARQRQQRRPKPAEIWVPGTHVLWRGVMTEIRIAAGGERPAVCLAADVFRVSRFDGDLRPTLESHFLRRAKVELPARAWELSAVTGVEVNDGGWLPGPGAVTVIVKPCSTNSPPESLARTMTGWLPTCASVGVQVIRPVVGLIVMPAGAVGSE